MSLKVGQIRKDDISFNCFTQINNIEVIEVDTPSPFEREEEGSRVFKDFAIVRTGQNASAGFERGKVYYFRFKIQRVPQYYYSGKNINYAGDSNNVDKLSYSLILKEGESEKVLTSFSVPIIQRSVEQNDQTGPYPQQPSYYLFETTFSPVVNSTYLIFRLDRIAYDVFSEERNWLLENLPAQTTVQTRKNAGNQDVYINVFSQDRLIVNNNSEGTILCELHNIIPQGQSYWKKFGFQSRPGSLIAVNKEPIRVGRSGIYEINNGTRITNFMIAPSSENDIDHFLLDYIATTNDTEEGGT